LKANTTSVDTPDQQALDEGAMDQHMDRAAAAELLANSNRWREAAEIYAEMVRAGRSDYLIHYNYGTVLMNLSRYEAACDQLIASLRYLPDSVEALNNLSAAHFKLGNPCAAEEACRAILAQHLDYHLAWSNLGLALASQGRVPDAIEALQHALDLVPNDRVAREGLLLNLNYIATDGRDLADVHRMLCADLPSLPRIPLPETSGRRIRVGYVSSDFKSHPVSFFMAGVIMTHDRNAFEIFCYSTTHTPDGRTENFRQLAEHFVDLATHSDAEAAKRIEADQVDILVDLGGHTSGNRLGVFALRPAPVQVSYLGYPATTGCAFIDYRVVDVLTDPEGSEAHSTERLVRLPAPFLCYYPHTTFPETVPLPSLANGYTTFGSFNHSPKISDDTLDLWSRVLTEVPDSRMFIKARAFSETAVCERFRERFAARGIEPSRLTFSGLLESAQDHLAAYGKVDIALDTFPYNGTTTTCEALWMGVPVISLVGDLHAARVGYTLLNAVGLGGFAITSAEDYVALAAALSEEKDHLANLRSHLQQVVANSPLCDRFRLTKGLEDTYRKMLAP
jgi:predicted O-linked N-acetylglucosamine transferase (SPINDLY family)